MTEKITIAADSYSIDFDRADEWLASFLRSRAYSQIAVLVDENTERFCIPLIGNPEKSYTTVRVRSGEIHKNLDSCNQIWRQMADYKLDRKSLLINLGGGVIGDMGGFCASCYMRGIEFIHIPTTLLSQVDASVGGKLGIDFEGLKNFIGLFKQPKAIVIDERFLDTLPESQVRSGFAEIIKHYLIADKKGWDKLRSSSSWKKTSWSEQIFWSVSIKNKIVNEDPQEMGLRKILNFGHTLGHAYESLSLYTSQPLLHGEAIALGMISEAAMSSSILGLSAGVRDEICTYILKVFPDLGNRLIPGLDELRTVLLRDKKNENTKILFSLLRQIGDCKFNIEAQDEDIEKAILFTRAMLHNQ